MMRVKRSAAILGMVLVGLFGLTGCDDEATDDLSPQATTESPGEIAEDEDAPTQENPAPDGESGQDSAQNDAEGTAVLPADLPEGLPDIGVPFYQPAELVATPSVGGPWVLEFVTDHELTIVNNTIANEFSDLNGWEQVNREVEGQRTVTQGMKDGYHLVIAVASEPQDESKTSLYYTLSVR